MKVGSLFFGSLFFPLVFVTLLILCLFCVHYLVFLPHDASAERGYEIAFVCLSVRP